MGQETRCWTPSRAAHPSVPSPGLCVVISKGNVPQSAAAFCKQFAGEVPKASAQLLPSIQPPGLLKSSEQFPSPGRAAALCCPRPASAETGLGCLLLPIAPGGFSRPWSPPSSFPGMRAGGSSSGRSLPGAPAVFALTAGNVPAGSWLLSQSPSSPFRWFSDCWLVFYTPVLLLPLLLHSCFIPLGAGGVG